MRHGAAKKTSMAAEWWSTEERFERGTAGGGRRACNGQRGAPEVPECGDGAGGAGTLEVAAELGVVR